MFSNVNDFKKIIQGFKTKRGSGRGSCTLYMSKSVFNDFKKLCEANGANPSPVVEEWMRQALAEAKKKG